MAGFTHVTEIDAARWQSHIIVNSGTVYKGSFVKFSSGFVTPITASDRIAFFVKDITDEAGIPLDVTETTIDGTYTKGGPGVANYAAAADNQTVYKAKVLGFWVAEFDEFVSVPDADIGTTTGSDLAGYYTDLTNSYTVDETSATTSAAQLYIKGLDRIDSSKGRYVVAERQTSV